MSTLYFTPRQVSVAAMGGIATGAALGMPAAIRDMRGRQSEGVLGALQSQPARSTFGVLANAVLPGALLLIAARMPSGGCTQVSMVAGAVAGGYWGARALGDRPADSTAA